MNSKTLIGIPTVALVTLAWRFFSMFPVVFACVSFHYSFFFYLRFFSFYFFLFSVTPAQKETNKNENIKKKKTRKIFSSPSSWMDGVFRAVRWVMRGFDAADSERTVRPESPTSPPVQHHSILMPTNQREGWEGQRKHHILPKGALTTARPLLVNACLTGETCAKNFADTCYTASGPRAESQP